MTIFVQIAAYRDSELGPTMRDCFAKAKRPQNLRIGLCLQDDLDTDYGVDFNDSRIRLIRVHWRESQGVCWARNKTQTLYDGEAFTLQIDSHHRFAEHWDDILVKDFEQCDSSRPILSTYPGSYYPETGKYATKAPNKIVLSRFDHKGSLKRYPLGYKANSDLRPIPARMIAAGFLFAQGQFCEDIAYDPEMYFAGEELSLTVRGFTHGYDIFHPQRNILWHEYVRESKPKHWFDHTESDRYEDNLIALRERDDMERFYDLLNNVDSDFGVGLSRSVHDYERFAGIDLHNRVVHLKTRLGIDPSTVSETEWQDNNQIAITERARSKFWFTSIDLSASVTELAKAKIGILTYYDRDQKMIERVTINNTTTVANNSIFEQELKSNAPPSHWVLTGFTRINTWEQICSEQIYDVRLLA